MDAAGRLGLALGLRVTLTPRWGDLQLVTDSENGNTVSHAEAVPASVEMDRVAETMAAIEDIAAGRRASDAALAVTAVATLGKRAATSLHVA